jgi:drug/metabolite transporter (DMT)-like permease
MVTATTFMFYSLQKFDLVDIYVVFFSAPLIVSLLSAYFLKDILSFKGIMLMLSKFWFDYLLIRTKYENI